MAAPKVSDDRVICIIGSRGGSRTLATLYATLIRCWHILAPNESALNEFTRLITNERYVSIDAHIKIQEFDQMCTEELDTKRHNQVLRAASSVLYGASKKFNQFFSSQKIQTMEILENLEDPYWRDRLNKREADGIARNPKCWIDQAVISVSENLKNQRDFLKIRAYDGFSHHKSTEEFDILFSEAHIPVTGGRPSVSDEEKIAVYDNLMIHPFWRGFIADTNPPRFNNLITDCEGPRHVEVVKETFPRAVTVFLWYSDTPITDEMRNYIADYVLIRASTDESTDPASLLHRFLQECPQYRAYSCYEMA